MNSREAVLANIRRSLGVRGDEAPRKLEVETRLMQAPAGVVPKRGQGDVSARLAIFKEEAERAQASLAEVAAWTDAPAEVARFLRENNCPATLRMGADARLHAMPWSETSLEILHGASDGRDVNAVSAAFAGIAETGTLALVSGADNPTTLNFLSDNHIVVLSRDAIWPTMRARSPSCAGPMARAARRARSISSPAPHARPISSRRCCSALTDRAGCILSSSVEPEARPPRARKPRCKMQKAAVQN